MSISEAVRKAVRSISSNPELAAGLAAGTAVGAAVGGSEARKGEKGRGAIGGAAGGALGTVLGGILGAQYSLPIMMSDPKGIRKAIGIALPIVGALGGGAVGGSLASGMLTSSKKEKTSAALDILWEEYGPGLQKHAALDYLYRETKGERDAAALTPEFCKLASAYRMDPWVLADNVANHIGGFGIHAKYASDPRARRLAQFYVTWADDLEKRAGIGLLRGARSAARATSKFLTKPRRLFRPKGTSARPRPMTPPKNAPAPTGPVRPQGPAGSVTSSRSGAMNVGETSLPATSSRSGAMNLGTTPAGAAPMQTAAPRPAPTTAPAAPPVQPPPAAAPTTAPATTTAPAAAPKPAPKAKGRKKGRKQKAPPAQAPATTQAAAPTTAPAAAPTTAPTAPPASAPAATPSAAPTRRIVRRTGAQVRPRGTPAPAGTQAPPPTIAPGGQQMAAAKAPTNWKDVGLGGAIVGVPAAAYLAGGA